MSPLEQLITTITRLTPPERNRETIKSLKRKRCKEQKTAQMPTNIQLLKTYYRMIEEGVIQQDNGIEQLLRKRSVRSMSGIVPIQVLTKPFWCPGECIFCPTDATMPKSYINTQPGAMRALLNQFDPYKQTYNRLLSLTLTGHATDKIEMIVLGGTRDVYPQRYKTEFVKGLYDACNSFDQFMEQIEIDYDNPKAARWTADDLNITYPETIEESITINETAKQRIIGLTIETRPEYVDDKNCQYWRTLGVTRIEMGIQTLHNDVHEANKRGHDNQAIRDAMHKLRQYGFKVSNHYMPGLYESTLDKDIETFRLAYASPRIKSDEQKFYPTAVIPNTGLYDLYKAGKYEPLNDEKLEKIIRVAKTEIIPPYTRIKRLARDFDTNEVVAGANTPNLRQLVMRDLHNEYTSSEELRVQQYQRLASVGGPSTSSGGQVGHSGGQVGHSGGQVGHSGGQVGHSGGQMGHSGGHEESTRGQGEKSGCQVGQPEGDDFDRLTVLNNTNELVDLLGTPISLETESYTSLSGEDWDIDNRIEAYALGGFDTHSERAFVCLCTRCREMKNISTGAIGQLPSQVGRSSVQDGTCDVPFFVVRRYRSSVGEELFVSFEDRLGYLYGFTRVLLPDQGKTVDRPGLGAGTALIRELHVYGKLTELDPSTSSGGQGGDSGGQGPRSDLQVSSFAGQNSSSAQHKGYGAQLLEFAAQVAQLRGYERLSVISGVGVKKYYEKVGYERDGTYMVRQLG